jgi:hypothetical protein
MGIGKEGDNIEFRKVEEIVLKSLKGREQYFGVKIRYQARKPNPHKVRRDEQRKTFNEALKRANQNFSDIFEG